jgi:hypothetical protein
MMLWNIGLTVFIGLVGWVLKDKTDLIKKNESELHRVQVLVNRTREEMAKEYVTKAEVHADINRVLNRLEILDAKLDRLMEKHG